MHTYAFHLDEIVEDNQWKALLPFVSAKRQHLFSRYYYIDDGLRSLVGELLIRYAVVIELGMRNRDISFDCMPNGKPFLKSKPSFHYSVSHSGKWVVCCTDNTAVGIDIEEIKPINVLSLSNRIFTKQEQTIAFNKPSFAQADYFYERWTLKESLLKNVGIGLRYPLHQLHIRNNYILHFRDQIYYLTPFTIDTSYQLAICTKNAFCHQILSVINYKELFYGLNFHTDKRLVRTPSLSRRLEAYEQQSPVQRQF